MATRSHWVIPLVIAIILAIIFAIGYMLNKDDGIPFWVWLIFILMIIFFIITFAMHAVDCVAAGPIDGDPYTQWIYPQPKPLDQVAEDYPRQEGSFPASPSPCQSQF